MGQKIARRETNMEKPLSIRIQECKDRVISAINQSELPASVLKEILQGLYQEIHQLAYMELEKDQKEYMQQENDIILNSQEE